MDPCIHIPRGPSCPVMGIPLPSTSKPKAHGKFASLAFHARGAPALLILHLSFTSPTSQLILQLFHRFTYVIAHSPTVPSLHLRRSSFSNPSVASHTSKLILQPFCRFTYVAAHSPNLPSLRLRFRSFSNPSFASPTS